jgi:GAF domain-containing protein
VSDAQLVVTASIGVASFPDHGKDAAALVKRADQALYHAKHEGRDRVEVWHPSLDRLGYRTDPLAGLVSGDVARDQRNLSALLAVIKAVRGQATTEDVLREVLDRVIEVTRAERALLFLGAPLGEADGGEGAVARDPALVAGRGRGGHDLPLATLRYSRSKVRQAVEERRALVILDAESSRPLKEQISASIEDLRLLTVMCVPLLAQEKILGAIYVDDKASSKEFTQADSDSLEAIAHQLALAIAFDPRFADDTVTAGEDEVTKLKREVARLRAENTKLRSGH